jgi:hypothetical protein
MSLLASPTEAREPAPARGRSRSRSRAALPLLLAAVAPGVAGCYDPSDPAQVQPFVISLLMFIYAVIVVSFALSLLGVRFLLRRLGAGPSSIPGGIPCEATIESIADTGWTASGPRVGPFSPRYRLGLRVTPADGVNPPYAVEVTAFIPRIYTPQIVPGARIGVMVDPADPANVRLDLARFGRPPGQTSAN